MSDSFALMPERAVRLADFIRDNVEALVSEWSEFAKTRRPASDTMEPLALQDHIRGLLEFISFDVESLQTEAEQVAKSKGGGPHHAIETWSAAEVHASLRHDAGFDIDQMVSEYRALRASVIKMWMTAKNDDLGKVDLYDLIRFNESLDQAITESIALYTKLIQETRDLFIGILGHDLKNPIGSAIMAAKLVVEIGGLTPLQNELMSDVVACTSRASGIVNDLLDLTRVRLGTELPTVKQTMEMAEAVREIVAEMKVLYPSRAIELTIAGDTKGAWDKLRIGQALSNLLGNAVAHGAHDGVIGVAVKGRADNVIITVHNEGEPIQAGEIDTIFDSLVQGSRRDGMAGSAHLGLGLYIVKRIVAAHRGTITVTSTARAGTTFTITLPRRG